MNKNRLFLLGGYDLEMIEIKKILQENGYEFQDKKLSWGAKLSDYQEYLAFDGTIYGIELELDMTPPKNYSQIDHHGKNDDKPSSLKQVADILGLELSREQQLIAANDSRYISGMKKLCATKDEIEQIRKLDQKAQGITNIDQELATQSLKDSNIVYSLTPYFSAVSDLVYDKYDKYIIYNDSKIVFYGYRKQDLLKFLEDQNIAPDDIYYGGGDFGFVGIKIDRIQKEQIDNLIKEFKKVKENQEKTISHHIFMLPFKFSNKDQVIKNFKKIDEKVSYNEQAYFYKFFIDSMFKNCEIYETQTDHKTLTMKKSKLYKLDIEKIQLRIFDDFNVGILSFHIENKKYYQTQDILEINDYTRRIYPEYLNNGSCNLVPEYIEIEGLEKEPFDKHNEDNTPKISDIITQLIGNISPAVDDRMFTISYFNNPNLVAQLKENYECNDKWYEYIFVDGDGKTVQDNQMQKEHIKRATYSRWKDYGTMYGMSRYSFVCLANSDFPLQHMKTMYFSMFSLLLMVRATLLKFADDVSEIAKDIDTKDISNQVNDTYKDYIKFINKYYFREITAKDQGLELYEKALETLNVSRDVKDLDNEIEELFKYVELQSEKKSADSMNLLTWIGGVLLPPSILTGFFGMNTLSESMEKFTYSTELVIFSAFIIPIIIGIKKLCK